MVNDTSRTPRVIRVWFGTIIAAVILSVALGAHWSTTVLVFVMCAAPMAVALALGFGGARTMTTHELLHAVDTEKKRLS